MSITAALEKTVSELAQELEGAYTFEPTQFFKGKGKPPFYRALENKKPNIIAAFFETFDLITLLEMLKGCPVVESPLLLEPFIGHIHSLLKEDSNQLRQETLFSPNPFIFVLQQEWTPLIEAFLDSSYPLGDLLALLPFKYKQHQHDDKRVLSEQQWSPLIQHIQTISAERLNALDVFGQPPIFQALGQAKLPLLKVFLARNDLEMQNKNYKEESVSTLHQSLVSSAIAAGSSDSVALLQADHRVPPPTIQEIETVQRLGAPSINCDAKTLASLISTLIQDIEKLQASTPSRNLLFPLLHRAEHLQSTASSSKDLSIIKGGMNTLQSILKDLSALETYKIHPNPPRTPSPTASEKAAEEAEKAAIKLFQEDEASIFREENSAEAIQDLPFPANLPLNTTVLHGSRFQTIMEPMSSPSPSPALQYQHKPAKPIPTIEAPPLSLSLSPAPLPPPIHKEKAVKTAESLTKPLISSDVSSKKTQPPEAEKVASHQNRKVFFKPILKAKVSFTRPLKPASDARKKIQHPQPEKAVQLAPITPRTVAPIPSNVTIVKNKVFHARIDPVSPSSPSSQVRSISNTRILSFRKACISGALDACQQHLSEDPALDLNHQDAQGLTFLMLAVKADHLHIVRFLLAQKVNSNLTDHQGKTALQHADINNIHLCDLLIATSNFSTLRQSRIGIRKSPSKHSPVKHMDILLRTWKDFYTKLATCFVGGGIVGGLGALLLNCFIPLAPIAAALGILACAIVPTAAFAIYRDYTRRSTEEIIDNSTTEINKTRMEGEKAATELGTSETYTPQRLISSRLSTRVQRPMPVRQVLSSRRLSF